MATHLVTKSQSILRQINPLKASLNRAKKVANLPGVKLSSRSLASVYNRTATVRALTAPFLMPSATVRHYSGREARRAQRQAAQVQVKEREAESTYGEVVPQQERPAPSYQNTEQRQHNYYEEMQQYRDPNTTSEELMYAF